MSTIKSSDEHLTLNADGSSKDIKFQANGVEKASISSAGAFTSTTIDATKLTGALPAISGAALTGVGVAGISSSADATAMTITSAERIGIGDTTPSAKLEVEAGSETAFTARATVSGEYGAIFQSASTNTTPIADFRSNGGTSRLQVLSDGRGLSQFTAKAWCNVNATGTAAIRDSHNVSSISDSGTGQIVFNWQHALGNQHNYCPLAMAYRGAYVATYTLDQNNWESDVRNDGGNSEDPVYLTVAVFSD